jgi:hypothetical protein
MSIEKKILQSYGYTMPDDVQLEWTGTEYAIWKWPTDSPPTIAEIEAIVLADPIQTERSARLKSLNQWWDTHSGIEVADGIILPIQEAGRNTNASSLTLGLVTQSQTIDLVSVEDYTVTISASDAITALGVFRAAYGPISAMWDSTHRALIAATTLEELNAVEMPQ